MCQAKITALGFVTYQTIERRTQRGKGAGVAPGITVLRVGVQRFNK